MPRRQSARKPEPYRRPSPLDYLFKLEENKNLALGKPAWQANNWPNEPVNWGAAKAVDGKYSDRSHLGNQCTISGDKKQTATWRVDLGRVVSISYINIFYRTDNKQGPTVYVPRFAGFFLFISNTTSKEDGYLCFHEIQNVSGTPIEDQRINCSLYGRYVIYYNERRPNVTYPSYYSTYAFNELCELEVYGCLDPGFFGHNCEHLCPENCQEQRCNITTGDCLGCLPGYKGLRCSEECDGGMYGLNCSKRCGNCFSDSQCHHINGICFNGCSTGYKEELCIIECDNGMYGDNCGKMCGQCINETQCHYMNGTCDEGCSAGYKGPLCDKECNEGMYGEMCRQICGKCFGNSQCHHINGTCAEGCSVGYKGPLCDKECDNRTFGDKCNETCGNCINETQCHHVNSSCMNGCSVRYDGSLCVETCSDKSSETISCPKSEQLKESEDSSSIPVIGGVLAAVIVLSIIILSVILIRRSRTSKNSDQQTIVDSADREYVTPNVHSTSEQTTSNFTNIYSNTEETTRFMEKKVTKLTPSKGKQSRELNTKINEREDEIDNDEKIHEENPYGDFYMNEETIPDIEVEKLGSAIKEKRKNEDDGFKREYAAMPYGEKYPCDAGKQPENVPKNRFKTTFPYDHSRIKLLNNQSDYINANYVDGIDKSNQYIATQGPRQNTVKDFWTMIWQENVNQIIMLTNLKEGNKAKCSKYWPSLYQSTTLGVISLLAEEEQTYANYTIRRFRVTHKVHNKSRIVTQYHYTAWPDHGIPEQLCLVIFHDHVTRTTDQQNTGPTVVHCSAGIGRTGTYIALDALYKAGKTERKINIAKYVKKMRENRMNMVQTYEQYKIIFLALEAVFKAPTCVHTKPEFIRKAELMTLDKPANESELRKEFQNLLRVRPTYTEAAYKFALESGESKSSVLPLDKYSLFLSSSVPKRGNYVNAITLPSYIKNKAFIITHYPPPEEAVDFLRLLTDHESDVVICMDPLTKVESTKIWLPAANSIKTVSPFTVNCGQEQVTDIKCTTISIIQDGANDEGCSVTIIQPKDSLKITENSQVTMQMLHLVSCALQSETEGPITVVSSDGSALCGVFCAVYNTLQQLSMDGEVDIFSAVQQLQIRRPELCSTMEEYMMIYNVVLDYIHTQEETSEENIYSNQ
ncbi:receptor-type tyrosine-protein phosphatase mu-like [Saccostrea echinata]|uniref:receptor-type tyrosine-protein phosphatase mu-like n=1 Tax=Saccostrea echinata TaxID=191078 RepID=UPI002A83CD54|nr:receptor-type tyrosine-protein phosphatase mu-like [Saccostrea echinata]